MPGFYPEANTILPASSWAWSSANGSSPAKRRNRRHHSRLASNGLHTNGYSLARKLLFEVGGYTLDTYVNEFKGKVGNELMRTHKSYWPIIRKCWRRMRLRHGSHHRRRHHGKPAARPAQRRGRRHRGRLLARAAIFEHLQKLGNVPQDEMLRTFNMGLGMLLVIPSKKFKKAQSVLERAGEKAYTVGRIVKGDRKVMYT